LIPGEGAGRYDALVVKHFTKPWVLLALLEAGVSPDSPRIKSAVRELVLLNRNGLWDWGEVGRPIWATHDALCSLSVFALVSAQF
jgi:hypothetical protein